MRGNGGKKIKTLRLCRDVSHRYSKVNVTNSASLLNPWYPRLDEPVAVQWCPTRVKALSLIRALHVKLVSLPNGPAVASRYLLQHFKIHLYKHPAVQRLRPDSRCSQYGSSGTCQGRRYFPSGD